MKIGRRTFLGSALGAAGGYALGQVVPFQHPTPPPPPDADLDADLGLRYHEWSKPGRSSEFGPLPDWGTQPARYKTYPQAPRVSLPKADGYTQMSLEAAITARRSVRGYGEMSLSPADLGHLLSAAQGITEPRGELRAAPSAGALYPIEVYPVVHRVADLEPGVYHYAVEVHELELLEQGDLRASLSSAALGQGFLGQANVCFVLSAIFQRIRWKYRERTYRYVLLEAGHIAQNLCLAATAMGMGSCPVGAFFDDDLNALVGLDGRDEAALYIVAVGVR
jgi:SagB-type dehydrogenase family enzyme